MGNDCECREIALNGCRAIQLENELISVVVLPHKGADIYSFISKPHGLDVLWKSPWQPRAGTPPAIGTLSEAEWLDRYEGGWQLIFPNGGDACTYRGAPLGFHGEASASAWEYSIRSPGPTAAIVDMHLSLRRSPFRVSRTLSVERGSPILRIFEVIENLSDTPLHYMWGHHPAFGRPFLDGGRLQLRARRFQAHDVEISPTCRISAGTRGGWPVITGKSGEPVDLSAVPPEVERVTEFGYITDVEQGWYAMVNPERNLGFGLAWPPETFPYLWFWQELGGTLDYPWYGRCSVMAVEPFTSIPGVGLEKAIAEGTAPILQPRGHIEASFAAVLFEAGEAEHMALRAAAVRERTAA
jgi:hypothetical protein